MCGKQLGFSDYELTTAKKQTKREKFLAEMEVVVPPRFQESCHPCDQYTRGLEDMTNASLQRGCKG